MNDVSNNKMNFVLALVALTLGIMVTSYAIISTLPGEDPKAIINREFREITQADADPGAGNSGLLNIFIYPHSADPGTDYATNLTEVGSYAYGHLNTSLTGTVPYDTEFDIVVKCRFNATHAYNSTGSNWEPTWVRANMTCADLSIAALTAMTQEVVYDAGVTYIWVQFYMNNGGAGYTITHGQTVNVTALVLQAYY